MQHYKKKEKKKHTVFIVLVCKKAGNGKKGLFGLFWGKMGGGDLIKQSRIDPK
jgi:hypothetical protein